MKGCITGCLGRLAILAGVCVAAIALYVLGPRYLPEVANRFRDEAERREPSAEIAEETLARIEELRSGGDRLALGAVELTSLIRFALPGLVPKGIGDPTVELRDGHVLLSARVATVAFPDAPPLDEVLGLIPDTVEMQIRGSLLPFEEDEAALHVDRVQALLIPLPARFIPEILSALGRVDRQALPTDAIVVRLPQGLNSAYVLRDSLVLVAER